MLTEKLRFVRINLKNGANLDMLTSDEFTGSRISEAVLMNSEELLTIPAQLSESNTTYVGVLVRPTDISAVVIHIWEEFKKDQEQAHRMQQLASTAQGRPH